jgi:hypothetical protein
VKTACCLRARACCHCSTGRARKTALHGARALPPAKSAPYRNQPVFGITYGVPQQSARVSSRFARQPPALRGDLSETRHSRAFLPPTRWPPCPSLSLVCRSNQ